MVPKGRFVKNGDDTIRDNELHLDWYFKDNGENITHDKALEKIAEMNAREKDGKWELPTMDELYSLFDENASPRKTACGVSVRMATDLIHVTCNWFWASDEKDSGSSVGAVALGYGSRDFYSPSTSDLTRFCRCAEAIEYLILFFSLII